MHRKRAKLQQRQDLDSFLDADLPQGRSFLADPMVERVSMADLERMRPSVSLDTINPAGVVPFSQMPTNVRDEFHKNIGVMAQSIATSISNNNMRPSNPGDLERLRKIEEAGDGGATAIAMYKPKSVAEQRIQGGAKKPEDVVHSHMIDDTLLFVPPDPLSSGIVELSKSSEMFAYQAFSKLAHEYGTVLSFSAHNTAESFIPLLWTAGAATTVGKVHQFISSSTGLKFFRAQFVREPATNQYAPLVLLVYHLDIVGRFFLVVAFSLPGCARQDVRALLPRFVKELKDARKKKDTGGGYADALDFVYNSDNEAIPDDDDDVRMRIPFFVSTPELSPGVAALRASFLYHYYSSCQCTNESIESERVRLRAKQDKVEKAERDVQEETVPGVKLSERTRRLLHSAGGFSTNAPIGKKPVDYNSFYAD